ncbi:MAG: acyl-CoA dehydrogenase family protein [Burkholderiales bacterium]
MRGPENSGHCAVLQASVADFVRRGSGLARARRLRDAPQEYERDVWSRMAQMGWLGVLVGEACGGSGLGLTEAAIVAKELARALAPEPFTAVAVLAASVLAASDNETLKRALLSQLVSGALIPVLAWQERAGVTDATAIETRAVPAGGGFLLEGGKRFVAGAAGADGYIVSAKTARGIAMFWVARDTPGVGLELETLADGRHFGVVTLSGVAVAGENRLAEGDAARDALEKAFDHAAVIAGAELCGVMDRALEMSLDYMKTRVQFGKPIGSFQALQHRAVDLYIQRELAAAVLEEALRALDRDPAAASRAAWASRVKARCSDAGLKITREAIQIHGAIGFTDEYDVGLYLKRAVVLAAWLGNAAWHRRRYAQFAAGGRP